MTLMATRLGWHYGAITKPGKYDSYFLPLNVDPNDKPKGRLECRRYELLSRYTLTDPDLTVAENKRWRGWPAFQRASHGVPLSHRRG